MTNPHPQFDFVFPGGGGNAEDDGDVTDEDMPPLEETPTEGSSSSHNHTGTPAAVVPVEPSSAVEEDPKPMDVTESSSGEQQEQQPQQQPAAEPDDIHPFAIDVPRVLANLGVHEAEEAASEGEDDGDDDDESLFGGNGNPFAALQSDSDDDADDSDDDDDFLTQLGPDDDDDDDDEYDEISIDEEDSEEVEDYDEDEDDDDEDDNSQNSRAQMPAGLLDFFRALTNAVEQDEEPNDDEDDDSDCNCPRCWMSRFGLAEDDHLAVAGEEDEDDKPLDPLASPCAICLEPETKKRKFVCLPCCGGTSIEATSSTRFCHKCVVQYMARTGNGVPLDRSANNNNSNATSGSGTLALKSSLVGECPRCKQLLALTEKKTKATKKKKLPKYMRTQLLPASAHQYHWYIGRIDSGNYRVYLLTLAWCDPNFIAEELLLNDSASADRIAHLCQWGILQKVKPKKRHNNNHNKPTICTRSTRRLAELLHRLLPGVIADPDNKQVPNHAGAVYTVSYEVQSELRNLLVKHMEMDEDWGLRLSRTELDEPGNGGKQSFMVACNCAASAFMAVSKLRLGRAIRLLNRGMTLALASFKCLLPNVTKWPSDLPTHTKCWHAATFLNVVLLYFVAQILAKALWIAWFLFKGFCACRLLALCVVRPPQKWKRVVRNVALSFVFFYFVAFPLYSWYTSWKAMDVTQWMTTGVMSKDWMTMPLSKDRMAMPLSTDWMTMPLSTDWMTMLHWRNVAGGGGEL